MNLGVLEATHTLLELVDCLVICGESGRIVVIVAGVCVRVVRDSACIAAGAHLGHVGLGGIIVTIVT